ncbi:MAG: tyrosine-type recombinase/integrase [Bacteriovoracia bacterium]
MAISSYEKDGKTLWMVYVNIRSKVDPTVRVQKRVFDFKSENAALAEERKLLRDLTEQLVHQESRGPTWRVVIEKWESAMRSENAPVAYAKTTIIDHVSNLMRWTETWLRRRAGELTRADGREILRHMELAGKSKNFRKNIKHTINVVYKWAIDERLLSVGVSPVEGLKIDGPSNERVPDILTLDEIRKLLLEARRLEHPWYPVWTMALLTGMRNGELHALLWSDVDFENRRLTVSKSFNTRMKSVKTTKAGYWRTVPISDELFELLSELKATAGERLEVLPRFWEWDKGEQARVLRKFCLGIGIRTVCFHALRACFATQLLAHDIAPARVMKICGWRDLKTMQHYIRLAGIDERGATQVLRILPSDAAVMGEVVSLFEFKGKKK